MKLGKYGIVYRDGKTWLKKKIEADKKLLTDSRDKDTQITSPALVHAKFRG